MKNAAERMLEGPQSKQCFVCVKLAQNKGKALSSLLVFTQLFRTRNKLKNEYFSFSLLTFLDHKHVCVLEKMTTLHARVCCFHPIY